MRPDEIERRDRAIAGEAVVANHHLDKDLIKWAKANGKAKHVGRTYWGWGTSSFKNPVKLTDKDDPVERDAVCDSFVTHLANRPDLMKRIEDGELGGMVLLCFCHPLRCHGDHLAKLANERRTGS